MRQMLIAAGCLMAAHAPRLDLLIRRVRQLRQGAQVSAVGLGTA